MQTLEQLLEASPVFAGLDAAHLATISGCAVNERFGAGSLLAQEGDPDDQFFLLRKGSVALEVAAPGAGALVIETLHPGDVVGWSWLFAPYRRQFDARAREATSVVAFDAACLRGKCEADHELGYELMRRFASLFGERLQATRLQLLDVYGHARSG